MSWKERLKHLTRKKAGVNKELDDVDKKILENEMAIQKQGDGFKDIFKTRDHVNTHLKDLNQALITSQEPKNPDEILTTDQLQLAMTIQRLGLNEKSTFHEWTMGVLKLIIEKAEDPKWAEYERLVSEARIFMCHTEIFNIEDPEPAYPDTARPFFFGNPFQTIFLERFDQRAICQTKVGTTPFKKDDEGYGIYGMLIHQVDADNYICLHLLDDGDAPFKLNVVGCDLNRETYLNCATNTEEFDATTHFLTFKTMELILAKTQFGQEKVDRKGRMSRENNRDTYRIKHVVHVRKRLKDSTPTKGLLRDINWSHRWEVMGHWRNIPGVGKDERGKYGLKGRTWVKPHVRGPEDKELVKKIRLVGDKEKK